MPLDDPNVPKMQLRFEVDHDGEGDPKVYGVMVPAGWPIDAPFPEDAPRMYVPVNEIRYRADAGQADRLTLVVLRSHAKLAGDDGNGHGPVKLHGRGVFPNLEVVDADGEPVPNVQSVLWAWDAHERKAHLLLRGKLTFPGPRPRKEPDG